MAGVLFEGYLKVRYICIAVQPQLVCSLYCESETLQTSLTLEISSWLYPMNAGDKFHLLLATTLREDGAPDNGGTNFLEHEGTRVDSFDFVMYGKVNEIDVFEGHTTVSVVFFAGFGGLRMKLQVDTSHLHPFEVDQHMYVLIKKLAL